MQYGIKTSLCWRTYQLFLVDSLCETIPTQKQPMRSTLTSLTQTCYNIFIAVLPLQITIAHILFI